MERVRVAAWAPDPLLLAGLVGVLCSRPDLDLVAEQTAGQADVLVAADDSITVELMAELRRNLQRARVPRTVLVVKDIRSAHLLNVVECGVVGVLARAQATEERLLPAVLSAKCGNGELPPELLGSLLTEIRKLHRDVLQPKGLTASGLAAREIEVLRHIAEGLGTAEIAQRLSYSERTVKNIVCAMTGRLGLKNRPHAVAYALRAGVI